MLVSQMIIQIDHGYCLLVALASSSDIHKQIFLCIIANDKKVIREYP